MGRLPGRCAYRHWLDLGRMRSSLEYSFWLRGRAWFGHLVSFTRAALRSWLILSQDLA